MAQGKRISSDLGDAALQSILDMGAAAKQARLRDGESQSAAAARLGVHVQTIARIESGEPGVTLGHMVGLLGLYGIDLTLNLPAATASASDSPLASTSPQAPATPPDA
jgi:HTH-type transcriptional regulator/antitoxin HipB